MTDRITEIVEKVGAKFSTFGGGRGSDWNPIAAALKDRPLQFAAGVSVDEVVHFIVAEVMVLVQEAMTHATEQADKDRMDSLGGRP